MVLEKIEADIEIFFKARKKYEKCSYSITFNDQMCCRLYMFTFDSSYDLLNHCGSCKAVTGEPTTSKTLARSK
jgi:hypothetical protein